MAISLLNRKQLRDLRPGPSAVPDDKIQIESGIYTKSTGTGIVRKQTAFASPSFPPVNFASNTRYDIVCLNDSGNAVIVSGAEVASPGDPIANAPALPADKLAVAIVRITEDGTVLIDNSDITDIREFLNKGGGGTLTPQWYQSDPLTVGQTVLNLPFTYPVGQHVLKVWRDGVYQIPGIDFTETSTNSVTLTDPVVDIYENIVFEIITGGGIGTAGVQGNQGPAGSGGGSQGPVALLSFYSSD